MTSTTVFPKMFLQMLHTLHTDMTLMFIILSIACKRKKKPVKSNIILQGLDIIN